jgi:hypothetical protein
MISEFMLRFMTWLCLKDNALAVCIVTVPPRIALDITLIDRMKKVFAVGSRSNGRDLVIFNTI